jgi:hypothetical protein
MKYIANIITKSRLDVGEYINVTKDITKVDLTIPTLIIGWAMVKEIYPNADILNKQISETVYWTYSNREKRQEYEPDLAKFIKNAFSRLETSIKYTFFNVLTNPLSRNKCLLKYINSPITKIVYITDKHIFIYDSKQVTGVSLSDLEFYGFERERIIDILKRNPYNRLVFSDSFLNFKIKRSIGDNGKIVPFLYSIKNDVF